jgi:hypothetical protein
MKKTIIRFDQDNYDFLTSQLRKIEEALNSFLKEFNLKSETKIVSSQNLSDALYSPTSFIKTAMLEGKEFKVGGIDLSQDKIFELGLVELPNNLKQLVRLSEDCLEKLNRIESEYEMFIKPHQSFEIGKLVDIKKFQVADGSISYHEEFLKTIKESFSFYLKDELKEDYQLLRRLIERAKSIEGSGNSWDKINLFLSQNLKVYGIKLDVNHKVFSE